MHFQKFSREEYSRLPHEPGVYKFLGQDKTIIYVGKAKDLVKRVSSYFTKTSDANRKTQKLVSEIRSIEVVVLNSEFDALLLENNLIKENQPRYNILLKDDKTFPSICITNERFPRIFSTRQVIPSQGEYFGPYTSVKAMNGVLDLIRKLYKIRTCNFNLSPENIRKKKFKICLEYHIGNCLGPCEGLQEETDYNEDIRNAREVLKGNIGLVKNSFKQRMQKFSTELKFELAQEYKVKLDLLEKFQSSSLVVSPKMGNVDVIGIIEKDGEYYANYTKIESGTIRVSETVEAKKKLDEPTEELFQLVLFNLKNKFASENKEVLTNVPIMPWGDLKVIIPKIGDKRKLVELCVKNALFYQNQKMIRKEATQSTKNKILEQLQEDLRLKTLPYHIECFDNSNIQGTTPVSSMVSFKGGKPSKKDYRKFNIRSVEGPNDFASMKEVVFRRYNRLKIEDEKFPDLIIVDGGKGQLSAAVEALKEVGVYGTVPIIGIAKRLEEIYYPEDPVPLHISKKSYSLQLLQHLRDEAHRFAITFHRQKRNKATVTSELDDIKGIGEKTKQLLLQEFRSVKRIREESVTNLAEVVGQQKAQLIHDHFDKKRKGD